jgi:hypothetical protein
MSIDKMNEYLLNGPVEESSAAPSSEEFDESDQKTGWAFGVEAEVRFEKEEMKKGKKETKGGAISTSLIVGSFNNKMDFRLNKIAIEVKTASLELEATVEFKLAGDTIGVSGYGSMEVGEVKIKQASFHYYKIRNTDLSIGAEIVVEKTVVTGPITWYSMGGGFNYNSSNGSLEMYFKGEAGPNGSPTKEGARSYCDIKYLGVEFIMNECGAKPILKGDVDFYMKKPKGGFKNVGNLYANVDFCRNILFVKGKVDFSEILPDVTVTGSGSIYLVGAKNGQEGAFLI